MAEKTVAQLNEEIKALFEGLKERDTRIAEAAKLREQDQKLLEEKDLQIKEQQEILKELTEQLKDKEMEAEVKGVVVSYKKDKYKVLGGRIKVGNQVFTAEELGENKEALGKLIESGSGFLLKL